MRRKKKKDQQKKKEKREKKKPPLSSCLQYKIGKNLTQGRKGTTVLGFI